MPWLSPKTDYVSNNGWGFADVNTINSNLTYLREENKTINGTNTFSGLSTFNSAVTIDTGTTNTALKLISTDIYVSLTMEDNTTTIPDAILRGGNNLLLLPSGGNASIGSLANPNADKLYVNGTVNIESIASFESSLISLKQSTSLASGLGASSGNDMQIIRGGSDSSFLGANLRFYDPSTPSLTFAQQLSASGHYDLWLYNGTVWNRQYRATREGRHLFGNGLVDDTINTVQIGGTLDINNIANFGSSSITMSQPLTINTGITNTALSLVSTDIYSAITMEDDTTTAPDAILRGGDNLLLVPNGGNTSIGSLSNPNNDKLYVNGSLSCTTLNTGQGDYELYAMNQNVRTTDNVGFNALALNANFNPTQAPSEGSWTLSTTPTIVPRGVYNITFTNFGSSYAIVECYIDGAWRTLAESEAPTNNSIGQAGCCVFSDGINVRISSAAGTPVAYYLKF